MKTRSLGLGLSVLVALGGALLVSTSASASGPQGSDHKTTFCHATASTTNPYVVITTDNASIIKRGHGEHTGPVFDPAGGKKQPVWGDIIPAFDYEGFGRTPAGSFPGLNVAAGAAILAAGCQVPVTPTPTPTPTVTPTPSVTPTPVVTPTPTDTPPVVTPPAVQTPVVAQPPVTVAPPTKAPVKAPVVKVPVKKKKLARGPAPAATNYVPPKQLAHTGPVNMSVLGIGLLLLGLGGALLFGTARREAGAVTRLTNG